MRFYYFTFIMILIGFVSNGQETQQEPQRDSLFFNFDTTLFIIYEVSPNDYYLKTTNPPDEALVFKKIKIVNCLNPKKVLNLDSFIKNSYYYDSSKKTGHYNLSGLADLLSDYMIYFVRKKGVKVEFIEVEAICQIE